MTGCLKIKNDTYYAVLNLKVGDKYKQKWISTKLKTKGNKRKATEFLNALIVEYEQKEIQTKAIEENENQCDILFTDYMQNWLEKKKNKIEITTWDGYYDIVIKHFVSYFEPLKLNLRQVKAKHIIDYYDFKFTSGKIRNKKGGLAHSSLRKHSVILKSILNQAFLEELIDRNPAIKVPIPKRDDIESKAKFLTAEEANKLLKIFSNHHLQPLIYLTLYYGLRRGEVIGLKWSAIDLKNNKLKINHTVTRVSTLVSKDKTKTSSSKREYTLLPEIKELLLKVKNEQKAYKKAFGKEYKNTDYVFTWQDGRGYLPEYITKEFKKVLAKNNFPKMRFHDLRHSCTSILYDKQWQLKDIQTWLGHSNIETTGNIYTHITKSGKEILARNLEHTFSIAI